MSHAHDHSNAGSHDHRLTHEHPLEDYSARKHPEFVVLEIGGNLGALVVHTDADMHGVEIEISPEHDHRRRIDGLGRSGVRLDEKPVAADCRGHDWRHQPERE